jgi:hypothetical protein
MGHSEIWQHQAVTEEQDLRNAGSPQNRNWEGRGNARYTLWLLFLACWLIQGMAARQFLDSDGIAYVDIARDCMRGNWHALVNGYWSPGYPALLSFWLKLFRPSAYSEITVVRLFACLSLALDLVCFEYFLEVLPNFRKKLLPTAGGMPLPDWSVRAVGYCLFLWCTVFLTPASINPPDLFVFAVLLLASATVVRISGGADGWLRLTSLGALLGIGYLAKAAMFPLAFVFLATLLLAAGNFRRIAPRVLVSFLIFLVIAGPFVWLLSKQKARLTVGDSGAIAYANAVNWVDTTVYWQGEPAGSGIPKHAVRKVLEVPPIYEYSTPVGGTYPLWYDHSYWYDGVKAHLELRRQLNVIHIGLRRYLDICFTALGPLSVCLLILLLLGRSLRTFGWTFSHAFPLWLPATTGLAMYAIVHVEDRFLSGFVILLWAAVFSALRLDVSRETGMGVRAAVIAVILVLGFQVALEVGHRASGLGSGRKDANWELASALGRMGIQPGDRVSYIGDALTDHIWAHMAGLSLASEIPERGKSSYWAADSALKSQVDHIFLASGAKAVVTQQAPAEAIGEGWHNVPGTDYYVLQFRP